MASITIPQANATFATGEAECLHCGKKMKITVKIDSIWYRAWDAIRTVVNEGL